VANKVEWPIDGSVKFPPRCLFCDADVDPESDRVTEMTRKFGQLIVRLRVPLCTACVALRRKRRAVWIASFFAYAGAVITTSWLLQRSGWSETHGSILFFGVCTFAATCLLWFMREEVVFLRRYTRVWIEALNPRDRALVLGSHDAKLIAKLDAIVAKRKPNKL
jgi:hypothetical protein